MLCSSRNPVNADSPLVLATSGNLCKTVLSTDCRRLGLRTVPEPLALASERGLRTLGDGGPLDPNRADTTGAAGAEAFTNRLISRLGAGTDTIASCPVTWFGILQRMAALQDRMIDLHEKLRTQ